MTLKEIKTLYRKELKNIYPLTEIDTFFFLTVEKELGFNKSKTLLNINETLSMGENIMFHEFLKRLKNHEPIQYILGETEFYGLKFNINTATLIPRPETEELVDWMITHLLTQTETNKTIIDIGTGSGCIAISLAKNLPNFKVSALDISKAALKVATKNAKDNNVKIDFLEKDILTLKELPSNFDVIVSNPPYVRVSEKKQMQKNVLNYEPAAALFVEDKSPLLFYKKITSLATKYLNKNGLLFFEINEYLSEEVINLLKENNFNEIELKKDFFGKDRMVKCKKK